MSELTPQQSEELRQKTCELSAKLKAAEKAMAQSTSIARRLFPRK